VNRDTVGVVIPVRDGERYLAEAIESVLDQSHASVDVVVVDDGSGDGSVAVAARYAPAVRCVSHEAEGIGAARNHGVERLETEYLAFLDSDDRWPRERLERQLAAFAAEPSLELVFGHVRQFVSQELGPAAAAQLRCPEGTRPAHLPTAMLARRSAWDRVGEFPTGTLVAEGLDWLLRARELGLREATVEDVVVERRLHETNNSRRHRDSYGEMAHALKLSLDRRRARSL
jgi:glycosyltransferase involved in cell wall biosynthesis